MPTEQNNIEEAIDLAVESTRKYDEVRQEFRRVEQLHMMARKTMDDANLRVTRLVQEMISERSGHAD